MKFKEYFFGDLTEDNSKIDSKTGDGDQANRLPGELGDKTPANSQSMTNEQISLKEAAMAFAISDSFKKELTDIAFGKKAISSQAQAFIKLLLQNPKLSSLQKKATLKRVIFDVDFKKHFFTEEEAIADGLTSYVSKVYYVDEGGHLIKEASPEEAKKYYDKISKANKTSKASKTSKANKATKSNK